MKKFLPMIVFSLFALCACAAQKAVETPGMLYAFKSAPINMNLSFDKDGTKAAVFGTVDNTGSYSLTLNIKIKMDARNVSVRVNDQVATYRTELKELGREDLPLEYFSMELPPNSSQKLWISWNDASAADRDRVTFYPVSADGPLGEEIHVDMSNVAIVQQP